MFKKIYALNFVNDNDLNCLVLPCFHVICEVFILFLFVCLNFQ